MVPVLALIFLVTYTASHIIIKYLFYKDVQVLVGLVRETKKRALLEEVSSKKFRLPMLRELYRNLYTYIRVNQRENNELKHIAAFRKEFIADVSHELKTPIFAAQGLVHTLLDGAVEDPKVRIRFLQKAAKSLDSLDILVHDLLTLSHIEIGETKMHFEYFDLKALAVEVIDQLVGEKTTSQLKLVIETNENKPLIVYADWLRIKQVLINLVSNGIKYSLEDGEVQLILKDIGDAITIEVKDKGEGIPNEDIERIFERFYRVDKSRSRGKGGTGLGLAIVKHIIEGHHTKIEVDSELGKGSAFRFTLPKGKR